MDHEQQQEHVHALHPARHHAGPSSSEPAESHQPGVDLVALMTRPSNLPAVPGLLRDITAAVVGMGPCDHPGRHELLKKARELVLALQTPREVMVEHCWAQTSTLGAINFGVETGLWRLMARNGDAPQRVDDLARHLAVDPVLLGRMMRHLSAMGYMDETGCDQYRPSKFTKCLSLDIMSGGYPSVLGTARATIMFHEYARARGWRSPDDPHDTPNMLLNDTAGLSFFAWLQARGYDAHFNSHMGGYRLGCPVWMRDYFPVEIRLIGGADAADPDAPFLVDVGGNVGHELILFQKFFPNHPGRLILQDLPAVIRQIKQLDAIGAIRAMEVDILATEQPVKGARAYFMHSILHMFPDQLCLTILENLKGAMRPGYSKILINEHVLPPTKAHWETSALDLLMMSCHSAKERTEAEWRHLLETGAGLKIVEIWDGGKGNESLIECELPDPDGRHATSTWDLGQRALELRIGREMMG